MSIATAAVPLWHASLSLSLRRFSAAVAGKKSKGRVDSSFFGDEFKSTGTLRRASMMRSSNIAAVSGTLPHTHARARTDTSLVRTPIQRRVFRFFVLCFDAWSQNSARNDFCGFRYNKDNDSRSNSNHQVCPLLCSQLAAFPSSLSGAALHCPFKYYGRRRHPDVCHDAPF